MTEKPTLEYYAIRGYKYFQQSLRVNVNLTDLCNNDCWYCNGNFPKVKHASFLTPDQFKNLLDFVNYQEKPMVYMTLIGGEPTLNKHLPDFMKKADKELRRKEIYVITNLLKPLKYFKSLPLRNEGFHFICSFHSHAIPDYEEWFEKIDYLAENRCLNTVFLMLTEDNVDRLKEIFDLYKDRYENIWDEDRPVLNVYAINQFGYTEKYKEICESGIFDHYNAHVDCLCGLEEEQIKVILSDGTNDYKNYQKYNNFHFMLCMSGLQVHADGYVTRCVHDRYPIYRLGMGEELKKINDWHLCKQKLCKCDLDFPKASVDYYLKNFRGKDIAGKILFGKS